MQGSIKETVGEFASQLEVGGSIINTGRFVEGGEQFPIIVAKMPKALVPVTPMVTKVLFICAGLGSEETGAVFCLYTRIFDADVDGPYTEFRSLIDPVNPDQRCIMDAMMSSNTILFSMFNELNEEVMSKEFPSPKKEVLKTLTVIDNINNKVGDKFDYLKIVNAINH